MRLINHFSQYLKNMITHIFLSNILECYYRGYLKLSPSQKHFWAMYDLVLGNRVLFYGCDNKALITTYPLDREFLSNTKDLMRWKNIINLYPQLYTQSLSNDLLGNPQLHQQLVELIKQNPGVDIIPYKITPEFGRLVDHLKDLELSFNLPETLPEKSVFIHTYLNSKRGFRHVWEKTVSNTAIGKKVFIPQGFITTGRDEALEAAWWFQAQNRSFVIKYNFGVQGIGVRLFLKESLPNQKQDFIKKMKSKLSSNLWSTPCLVVEEFIEPDKSKLSGSPSIEFFIDIAGRVHKTFPCEQIMEEDNKTFSGVYIHPDIIKNELIKNAYQAGMLFGKELSVLGYRGYFDIDLVISKDGQIYAVEANLRRTGGTHTYEFARNLLGKDYMSKYFVASQDITFSKTKQIEYKKAIDLLSNILLDNKNKSGVFIYNPAMLRVYKLSLFFIGKSHQEIEKYRQIVKSRLKINNSKR